jgi:hypothetical protein
VVGGVVCGDDCCFLFADVYWVTFFWLLRKEIL